MSSRRRVGNAKKTADECEDHDVPVSTLGRQKPRVAKSQTRSKSVKRSDLDPTGSTKYETNPGSRQNSQKKEISQLMTGNARKSDTDSKAKANSAASICDALLVKDMSCWGKTKDTPKHSENYANTVTNVLRNTTNNLRTKNAPASPPKSNSTRSSHSRTRAPQRSCRNLSKNKENSTNEFKKQFQDYKIGPPKTPDFSGWTNYESDMQINNVEERPSSGKHWTDFDPKLVLKEVDDWAPETPQLKNDDQSLKSLNNALWKNEFDAVEQLSKSKGTSREKVNNELNFPEKCSQILAIKEKQDLKTKTVNKTSVLATEIWEQQPEAKSIPSRRSKSKVSPAPTSYLSESVENKGKQVRGRRDITPARSRSRANIPKEVQEQKRTSPNERTALRLAEEDESSIFRKLVDPSKKNQISSTSDRTQQYNKKEKNDLSFLQLEKDIIESKPHFPDADTDLDSDIEELLEEVENDLKKTHNNRDLLRLAEADSSSMYKKLNEPATKYDLKYLQAKTQSPSRKEKTPQNDPFSSPDFFNFNEQVKTNSSDDQLINVLSQIGSKNGASVEIQNDEDDIDSRLNAELRSLFSCDEPQSICEKIPIVDELFKKPLPPVNRKETEAEIDARLQAELDSLPMVEADTSNDSVETLLDSMFNPDPQTTDASGKDFTENIAFPKQTQVLNPLPAAIPNPMGYKTVEVVNPGVYQMPNPVAANQHRTLAKVPMVTRVKGVQGEDISVKYTTGPDGLITNVQMVPPSMPLAQKNTKGKELESFTASQLHQIMQSGQPYLPLPMTNSGSPAAMLKEPLKPRDAAFPPEESVEDEEVDYEEIGVADTFAAYWPSKLKFGMAHPDSVVETATLSSVELPDISYTLALPVKTTDYLSALQLEAVVYACQAHEQILPSGERAGFLLGDGAGVGKGRTIAGIIFDNYVKGRRRALWVSVSNDLKFDAERDLADIGAHEKVRVVAISKFKYSRIDSEENENFRRGVIFCTYTALIGESLTANSKYKTRLRQLVNWLGKKFDGVIVFDECHKAKNLSLMNVGKSTKTGTTVLELQKLLPNARVVYASATGASEPRNMAYMVRLGLWGPGTAYPEFYEFVNAVEKRGIGAMEIVAMDMKLRGTYIARQLSFKDVSFRIEEVAMPKEFRKSYNLAAELWAEINKKFQKACRLMCIENRVQKIITCQFWCAHQRFFKNLCIASKVNHVVKMTRHATRMGKAVVIGLQSTGESRTLEHLERHHGKLNTFVSTSKMIIQSFVEKHFPAPKRDSFHHLLNTGEFEPEARSRPPRPKKTKMNPDWFDDDMDAEAGESDIEMYESTWSADDERVKSGRKRRGRPPKVDKVEKITMQERILQHLCNNMRAQDNDGEPTYTFDNTKPQKANITERDVERCINSRELLLEKIEILGKRMPANTLDKLISELGGTNLVAEMTGRRGRVVRTECDGYKYEPRCDSDSSMDLVNYREKQRFMDGSKHVAIISEAASSGISLQSDKRVSNQRRRLHITLELPWSADRAIQQFGRTHRSNQVNSPEYVFVITDLAGERRFASTVAKRLESLGALTQGDRRATDARDLSQFNIDNSIGRSALENVMQQLTGEKPLEQEYIPQSYKGEFPYDCCVAMAGVGMLNVREENKIKFFSVEKDSNNISKFLNRILGCRVEIQNALFKFFLDKMYSLIMQMKRTGRFDLGILDLDAHGASVKSIKLMRFTRKHATGTAATELHTVTVERGMSFETALAKYRKEASQEHDGFYVLQQLRHNKNSSILCLQAQTTSADGGAPGKVSMQIYRPNTGPQVRLESLGSITSRYVKVVPEEAHDFWQQQYDLCLNMCSHAYWKRACPFPTGCEMGLRMRTYHVLSGLMLPIWDRIEHIIEKNNHKIQIIRVKTDVNKKIVGTVVPHTVYDALVADLSSDSIVESH
uniref:Protein strawberry notch homolog 1 n=1 Tax=Drosophila rhopaloa TaxID=1041015 RepID=A0A6P4EU76_DRORH